jgi:ParB family transcriptional regulator, chromosome partitioning protein
MSILHVATRLSRYIDSVSAYDDIDVGLLSYSSNPVRDRGQDVGELMESIRQRGLLEPIIVRPRGRRFEVLAGNRRLKACKLLRHRKVKCIVTDLDDEASFEVSLIENIQRKTLAPLEEAEAFKRYCDRFGWGSQTDLAKKIGKSQEYISHRLKLLTLSKPAQEALRRGEIRPTSAEELVWIKDKKSQQEALDMLETKVLNTRSIRSFSKTTKEGQETPSASPGFYEEEEVADSKVMKQLTEAALVLRISLIRLDAIISKVDDEDLKKLLLMKRYSLHGLVDDLIRARAYSRTPLGRTPAIPL